MKVRELIEKFNLTLVAGENGLNRDVNGGHCGDLLSEVMGNAGAGSVWLTVQTHQNIVAVAVLREMAAIIITGGASAASETIDKADAENIPILTSPLTSFDLAGKIFSDLQ
jgi:predicted transcriptional regulator